MRANFSDDIMEVAAFMLLCCHIYELKFMLFGIPYYILADEFFKELPFRKTQSINFVNKLLQKV